MWYLVADKSHLEAQPNTCAGLKSATVAPLQTHMFTHFKTSCSGSSCDIACLHVHQKLNGSSCVSAVVIWCDKPC